MIHFSHVHKSYRGPDGRAQEALGGVSFEVGPGEFVLLAGHSGAGKSTLLKLAAGIERPSSGTVIVNDQNVGVLKPRALPYLRRHLGLIFQDQKLLFDRSVLDNVMLPLHILGQHPAEAVKRARAALNKVGLLEREKAFPIQLSGGQQQRLALARAIVHRPSILLADEPTANLDRENAARVMDVFRQFHQVGVTTLVSSHDESLFEEIRPRVLRLTRGRLEQNEAAPEAKEAA
jgi:cell division transport system ATP-binding protein